LERGWGLVPDPETYPLQYWVDNTPVQPLAEIPNDPEQAAEFWTLDAGKPSGQRLTDTTRRSRQAFEQLLGSKLWVYPPASIAEKLSELDNHRLGQREALLSKNSITRSSASTSTQITGAWVKERRTARNYSQRDLASHTGISQKMISMIENGERSISPINAERLLRVLQP
jgi:DNA-binding XRE family transcriptional regulator